MTYESFTNLIKVVDGSLERIGNELRIRELPDMTSSAVNSEIHAIRSVLNSIDLIAKTEGVDRYYEN